MNFLSPTLIDTNKNTNISKSTTDDKKILASRLATNQQSEAGLSIEEIALVTGHKDWRTLQRYTKLKPEELHKLQTAPHRRALKVINPIMFDAGNCDGHILNCRAANLNQGARSSESDISKRRRIAF